MYEIAPHPTRPNHEILSNLPAGPVAFPEGAVYRVHSPINWRDRGQRIEGRRAHILCDFDGPADVAVDLTDCRNAHIRDLDVHIEGIPPRVGVLLARSDSGHSSNWNRLERVYVHGPCELASILVVGAEFTRLVDCGVRNPMPGGRGLMVAHTLDVRSPFGPVGKGPTGVSQWLLTSDNCSYTVIGQGCVGVELARGVGGVRMWGNVSANGGAKAAYLLGGPGGQTTTQYCQIGGMCEGSQLDETVGVWIDGPVDRIDASMLRVSPAYKAPYHIRKPSNPLTDEWSRQRNGWVEA